MGTDVNGPIDERIESLLAKTLRAIAILMDMGWDAQKAMRAVAQMLEAPGPIMVEVE
jgi:hypothetical protein